MGYFLISEAETAVSAQSPASPKTHVPLPRLQERGHRFYSPETGRWANRDPLGDWVNAAQFLASGPPSDRERRLQRLSALPEYRFVDNRSSDQIDLLGLVNWKEKKCFWCVSPSVVDQAAFYAISAWAKAYAAHRYPPVPPSTIDTPEANAYRHCIWACRLTKEFGAGKAMGFELCHELHTPGGTDADTQTDIHNNAIGNAFGLSSGSCLTQCDGAMPPGGPPTLEL